MTPKVGSRWFCVHKDNVFYNQVVEVTLVTTTMIWSKSITEPDHTTLPNGYWSSPATWHDKFYENIELAKILYGEKE